MAASPVALSPRPNPPGTKTANPAAKARALAILNSSKTAEVAKKTVEAPTADTSMDLSDQLNAKVREQYEIGKKLGEGTYGSVFLGTLRSDSSKVFAIKRMKISAEYKDGIQPDVMREIKYLSELNHPYIIKLHEIFTSKDQNISIVLENLPLGDLEVMWKDPSISYTGADIKAWASMLCQAVWFCHENYIMHRDIKGNNVLIAVDGSVKLADFGLARSFADPGRRMTANVITRFYRPLELLYGVDHYSAKVDIWSVGCVLGELASRNFLLPSMTDLSQISVITEAFGTPTEEDWPGVSKLPMYIAPTDNTPAARNGQGAQWWRNRCGKLGEDGIAFVKRMMALNPNNRINARQMLEDKYWTNTPRPTKTENLPSRKKQKDEKKMAEDLKRKQGGEGAAESGRVDKVARKLNFGTMK